MGSGFSKIKKQARLMQEQYEKMQETMKNTEATGSSGNGLVTVVIDGEKKLKKLTIQPQCVDPQDVEGLQDLIIAACHDAHQKIEQQSKNQMPNLSSLPLGF